MILQQNSIGIFDSGVGGLSILKGIQQQLPFENLIYLGDMQHAPYGSKSLEYIEERAQIICQFLLEQQVKAIVVACNTATVSVVRLLRERFSVPIIGVEPAVKPAAMMSKTHHVGVLATERTLKSTSFNQLMATYSNNCEFHTVACRGLASQIEQLQMNTPQTRHLLQSYISPLLEKGIDGLVLGCTHYPFIKPLLLDLLPNNIAIYDTAMPVALQLKNRLMENNLISTTQDVGAATFYTSGNAKNAEEVFSTLLEKQIKVSHVSI